MYNFILQIFAMLSLGTIIFLVARTLPRISETETVNVSERKANRWSSFPFEKTKLAKLSLLIPTDTKVNIGWNETITGNDICKYSFFGKISSENKTNFNENR